MKRFSCYFVFAAALTLSILIGFSPGYARPIKLSAEFEGIFPASPIFGDLFGTSLSCGKDFFIVGSPSAAPDDREYAGAVYFYMKNVLGTWEPSQNPYIGMSELDGVSSLNVVTRRHWLFVSLPGTPSDDNVKNNAGSVLIFRRSDNHWHLVQTINNPLGPVNGSENFFGSQLDSDGRKWLLIGGQFTNLAYFYKLNKESGRWEYSQKIKVSPPSKAGLINVCVNKHHAFISYPLAHYPTTTNGKVLAFKHKDGTWEKIQTLKGVSPISPLYHTADSFGKAVAIHDNWGIIGASTDNTLADLAGAVYFYHYEDGKKKWVQKQKEYSTFPTVFFGSALAIDHNIIVISDPGRSVIKNDIRNVFQGAGTVYKKHYACWDESEQLWEKVDDLFDPNGRAYDFLGANQIDVHDYHIGIGSFPIGDIDLPDGFPYKRTYPFTANNGHALLYKINHNH